MTTIPNARSLVSVPGAPAIPALAFRRFRGQADYPLMVAILDACNATDRLEFINTVDEIAWVFAHLTNCDPVQDMLFAEVHGETVAFSRVWWLEESTGERLYISLGFVHPDWRRQGLGAAMLRYNECCLRQIAQSHPAESARFFRVWATDTEYGAQALFASAGYKLVRCYVEMIRPIASPLPDVAVPDGLKVRPVEPGQIRAIWEAMQEARRDHWSYVPPTEQAYERWTKGRLFAPYLWKVAWAAAPEGSSSEDQVAGMVLNRPDEAQNEQYGRKRGYTQDIFVRRPWRGVAWRAHCSSRAFRCFETWAWKRPRWALTSRTRAVRSSCTRAWATGRPDTIHSLTSRWSDERPSPFPLVSRPADRIRA